MISLEHTSLGLLCCTALGRGAGDAGPTASCRHPRLVPQQKRDRVCDAPAPDAVERYIKAIDIEEGSLAYDSEGRRLRLTTRRERRSWLFGLWRVPFDHTIVECDDFEPGHAEALRSRLKAFLSAHEVPETEMADSVPVRDLLGLAIERAGFTR